MAKTETAQRESHKDVVTKTRRDGVTQRYHVGRKPKAKAQQSTRPQPPRPVSTSRSKGTPSARSVVGLRERLSDLMAQRRAARQAKRAERRLTAKPESLSDWELYKARDLCREKAAELDKAITRAETPKEAADGMRALSDMEAREEQIRDEIRARKTPLMRLYYRLQGKDPRTGTTSRRNSQRKSGSTGSRERVSGGSDSAFEDRVGSFLTGWFDFLGETFSKIWNS